MRHELPPCFDGLCGAFRRNLGARVGLVIGNRFEIVGLREKDSLLGGESRIVLGDPQKLRLNAVMRFECFAYAFKNIGPRRVEAGKIGGFPA
jgi:hypothetical protein